MNVVDGSGWLEYFEDGPDAAFFAQTIQEVERLIVPTTTILEVFRHVYRNVGESDALQAAAVMQQGRVVDLTPAFAHHGGRLGVTLDVSLLTGAMLAVARHHDADVWTQEEELRGVERVSYRPRGVRR